MHFLGYSPVSALALVGCPVLCNDRCRYRSAAFELWTSSLSEVVFLLAHFALNVTQRTQMLNLTLFFIFFL